MSVVVCCPCADCTRAPATRAPVWSVIVPSTPMPLVQVCCARAAVATNNPPNSALICRISCARNSANSSARIENSLRAHRPRVRATDPTGCRERLDYAGRIEIGAASRPMGSPRRAGYGFPKALGAAGVQKILPARFTHLDAVSAGKKNPAFVTALAKDLSHPVKVHDGAAVDPDKFPGIERAGQLLDGFTQHQFPSADVEARVVVGGLDPFDIVDVYKGILGAVGHDQPPEILRLRGIPGLQ